MAVMLKVAWRDREHEGILLSNCHRLGVKGVAKCVAYDEGESDTRVHGILD
jgi:hypothetical protein